MISEKAIYDDEIDLREVARTILRYKWLILALPVLMAVVAWAITKFYLPRQYEATALVIITKPALTANFDERLQTTLQLPDAQTFTNLALADDLVNEVYQEVAPTMAEPVEPGAFKDRLEVTLVGTGQLRLTVTDVDPERTAEIANIWAEKLAVRLNELFGASNQSLSQIEQQIDLAYKNWSETQGALQDFLPQSQVESLQVRLDQARVMFQVYLDEVRDIDLIASDARVLDAALASQSRNLALRSEDAISLITLHQRAAGTTENNLQLQVSSSGTQGNEYTVADARENLSAFISSLLDQREELQETLKTLENQITTLAADLEQAQYQKTQLTVKRDLALTAYQALSSQAEETRIALAQDDQTAKVAGYALPPQNPSGPRSAINAIIAGILGLILGVTAVLARDWWQKSG